MYLQCLMLEHDAFRTFAEEVKCPIFRIASGRRYMYFQRRRSNDERRWGVIMKKKELVDTIAIKD